MILETATALTCLAQTIFWEGRSESNIAQIAISQVVMNRVNDHRFPDTVCGVVTEGIRYKWNNKLVENQCAFSFYCDGQKEDTSFDPKAYEWAEDIAWGILEGDLTFIEQRVLPIIMLSMLVQLGQMPLQKLFVLIHIVFIGGRMNDG